MAEKSEKAKKLVLAAGEVLSDEIVMHLFKNAARLKAEAGAFLAAFVAVLAVMLAFAYGLFVYEPAALVWRDGTTMWGIVVTRLIIFVPLIAAAWFFGAETVKTKKRCEEFFVAAFLFKELKSFVKAEDKAAFIMDLLEAALVKK
jgi:hypothetical protein